MLVFNLHKAEDFNYSLEGNQYFLYTIIRCLRNALRAVQRSGHPEFSSPLFYFQKKLLATVL